MESSLKQKLRQFTVEQTDGQLNSMLSRWFVEDRGTVNVSREKCTCIKGSDTLCRFSAIYFSDGTKFASEQQILSF